MGANPLSDDDCNAALNALAKFDGNVTEAAKSLKLNRDTFRGRIAAATLRQPSLVKTATVELPVFPDDDIPVSEIIGMMEKRFNKRSEHKTSTKWFPIKIKDNKPIGIAFMGDPHVDDDGCNWPLLRKHCEIMNQDGIYGVNIGDTTNNWGGRLVAQFANQETSQKTAHKLAKWLMLDSGIKWLCWLMGNHELNWNEGPAILRAMGGAKIPMHDWQAQFKLVFPNGVETKIWANHNFAGHSMWNTLHGGQKTAHMKEQAHIYVCGHHHNWALHQEESGSKDFYYWLARCRGYKYLDSYAELHGHYPQQDGATILAVINPAKKGVNHVLCFADLEAGAKYLKYLRAAK